MKQYLALLEDVLTNGRVKGDRTGTGTISVFGTQTRYNLENNTLPMVTTKKLFSKGVIEELLWMLRGDTNIKSLNDKDVTIWDEWAAPNGNLGPVYGEMWRGFPHAERLGMNTQIKRIDQIARLEADLRNNPLSRRHVVSAWHPGLLPNTSLTPAENAAVGKQALPPCHTLFQFMCEPMTLVERLDWARNNIGVAVIEIDEVDVSSMHEEHELADWAHAHFDTANVPRYFLSCQLYQRSADLFLGVPFNIMSYALLTHMLAHTHNMAAREFVHTLGDAHIYSNHVEQVKKQLGRKPKKLPTVRFNADKTFASVTDFTSDDIHIEGYTSHAAIKGKVAV